MEQISDHSVRLENRRELVMSGVVEVLSFDDGYIELALGDGTLGVEGEGLRITEFDSAKRTIFAEGAVTSLTYYDRSPKRGKLFGRRRT